MESRALCFPSIHRLDYQWCPCFDLTCLPFATFMTATFRVRRDNFYLRYATKIPFPSATRSCSAKRELLAQVQQRTGIISLRRQTVCFARRAARISSDLLFSDLDRIRSMARRVGRFQ